MDLQNPSWHFDAAARRWEIPSYSDGSDQLEFNMAKQSVQALMQDIRFVSEENYQIVEAVRVLVRKCFKDVSEEVKYGGILFTSGVQFAGVFAYKAHVSVELRLGAVITDEFGHLEGAGKGRRHVKLRAVADLDDKHLAQYLALALEAAKSA